jgi:putative hydrolase of the HAD superfamily
MIKAIAFDLGGVLFTEGKALALKKLEEKYSYDKDSIFKVLTSKRSLDMHKGLITEDEFWLWAKNQIPKGYNIEIIRREWYEGYLLDKDIRELIIKLKKNYKIIAFSGNIKGRIQYLDKKYDFRRYFDLEIYSYDHHVCKPDKEFIEVLLRESKLKPEEIVYIDDSEYWSKEAPKFGIRVIIYKTGQIEALKKSLKKLGISFSEGVATNKILHIEDYDKEKEKNFSLSLKELVPEHEVKNIEYLEELYKENLREYGFFILDGSFPKDRNSEPDVKSFQLAIRHLLDNKIPKDKIIVWSNSTRVHKLSSELGLRYFSKKDLSDEHYKNKGIDLKFRAEKADEIQISQIIKDM